MQQKQATFHKGRKRFRIEKFITGIIASLNPKLRKGLFDLKDNASAFSVSKSDIDKVCRYIMNQPEHHKKTTFAQEYDDFVKFYQKTLSLQIS